jgi:hypothetical protein
VTQGATHILLWLDALTAETANDWGDGLRALTEAELSAATLPAAPTPAPAPAPAPVSAQAAPAPTAHEVIDTPPAATATPADDRQARRRSKRSRES